MKNHFFISYFGNKRCEVKEIYDTLDLKDKKIIIEPYCGSSAMSYYISTLHPKKFKYILNDNSAPLIDLYHIFKDPEKLTEFKRQYNKILTEMKGLPYIQRRALYNSTIKDGGTLGFYLGTKINGHRQYLYPTESEVELRKLDNQIIRTMDCPIINFLRNEDITIISEDAIQIYKQYRDDSANIILLDPPYMMTCNSEYKGIGSLKTYDIYEELITNPNKKQNIYLVAEGLWYLKLAYKKYLVKTYSKTYTGYNKKKSTIACSYFENKYNNF